MKVVKKHNMNKSQSNQPPSLGQSGVSFDAFVREQERDPKFKALLDAADRREHRSRGSHRLAVGAAQPAGPCDNHGAAEAVPRV